MRAVYDLLFSLIGIISVLVIPTRKNAVSDVVGTIHSIQAISEPALKPSRGVPRLIEYSYALLVANPPYF